MLTFLVAWLGLAKSRPPLHGDETRLGPPLRISLCRALDTLPAEAPPLPDVAPVASPRPALWLRLGLRLGLRRCDVLLPAALALWLGAVVSVGTPSMDDYGLLPVLPIAFFVGVGLLLASAAIVLTRAELSPVRLGLHLGALVLVIHGTAPLVLSQAIYPWVYKHVGVVAYINLHGGLDSSVDIYHNWPGFFALAAWFTKVSGAGSPVSFVAWAPVYFNLLACLELGLVFRALGLGRRVAWIGLFLFVAGNWVGQDYFAPQAIAFVLSLAVFGMALTWMRADRPPALVRAGRRIAARVVSPAAGRARPVVAHASPRRVPPAAVAALIGVYAAIVVTHQLSPFMVLIGLALLTAAGQLRPRWVVAVLAAIAFGYLLAHASFLDRTQDLFASLLDPFGNVNGDGFGQSRPLPGRRLTAMAAPALVAGLWGLALLGALRRLRDGRPTLVLALLAPSPALVALAQSYGGEAVFRIYLFALPWAAALAASAFESSARRRPLRWATLKVGLTLAAAVSLLISAFYGSMELYQVRPGSVEASQYFYDNAEPRSVLAFAGPGFPVRVSGHYDEFVVPPSDSKPSLLMSVGEFRARALSTDDLPAVGGFMEDQLGEAKVGGYLALSQEQDAYARVLGLLPEGSISGLDRALGQSPSWRLFYRNRDAVIYRFVPGAQAIPSSPTSSPPSPPSPPSSPAVGDPGPLDPPAAEAIALPPLAVVEPSSPEATWTVVPGDTLWSVSSSVLAEAWRADPTDDEVAAYWRDVIAVNEERFLETGSPDVILPGQVLSLPARPGRA